MMNKEEVLKNVIEIQKFAMEIYEEESDDYVDYRVVKNKERAIFRRLSKITPDEELQLKILNVIETSMWDSKDLTYRTTMKRLREELNIGVE